MGSDEKREVSASSMAEALLGRMIETIEEYAMFALDEKGTIMSWNPGVRRLLGYERDEFVGRDVRMIFTQADVDSGAFDRELSLARRTGRASDRRRLRRKDGSVMMADGATIALHEGERFAGYAKVIHSDDERHRLERELFEARRQSERFVASASHELRTPLMAILGWVRVLQETDVRDDELRTALRIIEHNTLVEHRLVEELLDSARLLAGNLELECELVDLRQTVVEEVEAIRSLARDKEIRVDLVVGDDPLIVEADHERVRQVLRILLSNATKYTLENGLVHVELNRADGAAELIVSDSGVGIEPEFQAHLFERFRQAQSIGTLSEPGVGLGLSIARELVELHDGEITAASEGPGRGARFVVRLPIARRPRE